ncbi:leucine rich repeat domain protein [Emericellopsis atlantica]|uniref:Leucine rich repeat domain protein n=1 Tax=Emericellopsis atlantica TaxID=2614577 RepID=A0A9P7ZFX2_9HYPO|nr:leucine rich repeat domain protein [Emericellopsis atlantica]KAG9251378.1 leucine rich repeat domain protein [Emericellopsis atlantica]
MAEEPSLPRLPLPAVSWNAQTESFSNNPRKRRATRRPSTASGASVFNSSDPAIFSSDDDPALDNYVEGRQKRRYLGSWYSHQQHHQPEHEHEPEAECAGAPAQFKGKRTLQRQYDSGVFLASDCTEDDDTTLELECSMPTRLKLPQLEAAVRTMTEPERALQRKIRECVDTGNETVDFWNMGLEELSGETVAPLSHFEKIPDVVSRDVAFEQSPPKLNLYLAMNRLRMLPGALFDVTNLTTMSLRGNKLESLPPAFSKLCNLQELNLSQNRLRHLPVELLRLLDSNCSLQTLILHPNYFLLPAHGDDIFEILEDDERTTPEPDASELEYERLRKAGTWPASTPEAPPPRMLTRRLGRSPLQVSDATGRVLSRFKLPSTSSHEKFELLDVDQIYRKQLYAQGVDPNDVDILSQQQQQVEVGRAGQSAVPSLVEAVMRNCYRSVRLGEFKHLLPEDFANLRQVFDKAAEEKDRGGLPCSRCGTLMVVAPIRWIEWREINTLTRHKTREGVYQLDPLSEVEDELVVPFLHSACSWRCAPRNGEHSGWVFPKGCGGCTAGYTYFRQGYPERAE